MILRTAHNILAQLCSSVPKGSSGSGYIKCKIRSTSTANTQGTYTRMAGKQAVHRQSICTVWMRIHVRRKTEGMVERGFGFFLASCTIQLDILTTGLARRHGSGRKWLQNQALIWNLLWKKKTGLSLGRMEEQSPHAVDSVGPFVFTFPSWILNSPKTDLVWNLPSSLCRQLSLHPILLLSSLPKP